MAEAGIEVLKDLLIILAASLLATLAAKRLKQPAVDALRLPNVFSLARFPLIAIAIILAWTAVSGIKQHKR